MSFCLSGALGQAFGEAVQKHAQEYKSLAIFNEKTVSLKLFHLIKVRCSKSYLLPDMVTRSLAKCINQGLPTNKQIFAECMGFFFKKTDFKIT